MNPIFLVYALSLFVFETQALSAFSPEEKSIPFEKEFYTSMNMSAAQVIKNKKIALRKTIAQRISALTKEEKAAQSEYVAKKLLFHPEYLKSKRISIYLSTENEISTLPILEDIFRTGKSCFIPKYVKGNKRMDMVRLKSMEDYNSLPLNSWNIRTPVDSDRENAMDTGGVDLVVVPCAGITVHGARLGHGMGYYDLFLTKAKATTIAPVFREQLEDEIPVEDHDINIDHVLFMPKE